jgi:hypothetical protein
MRRAPVSSVLGADRSPARDGVPWSAGSLLGAHMTLNLAGWFGTAIVGTLHTFFPSLTQTHLRFAALQRPTFAGWTLGTAALATGYGFAAAPR